MVNSGIELLDYEIISGSIDNAVDENFYKEEIKADDNMIPFYSDDLKSLTAITRSEAILKSSPHQTFNFEEGDKFVDKMNLKGAKILKVKWNNNGTETHTVCAVSDREGILYDNFLSHCFEIKTEESVVVSKNETTDIPAKTPRLKAGSETVSSDGTVTWILTVEAWKASAGIVASIKITHIAYYTYGVFFYHYYSATHNCKIEEGATAVAKVKSINNKTIAYGYGLSAISSISISVTETGSGYNATMSPIDFNVASIGDGTHSHN
jgi:hypothetical protein